MYLEDRLPITTIGKLWETSTSRVWELLQRFSIPIRPNVPPSHRGPRNVRWAGDRAGITALHKRVKALRGAAKQCEWCYTESATAYDWACISGNYLDPNGYARLCRSCHRRHDDAVRFSQRGYARKGKYNHV